MHADVTCNASLLLSRSNFLRCINLTSYKVGANKLGFHQIVKRRRDTNDSLETRAVAIIDQGKKDGGMNILPECIAV